MKRRGTCATCGAEDVALRVNGTVWMHHDRTRPYRSPRGLRCDGSGELPVLPIVVPQACTAGDRMVTVPDISTWEEEQHGREEAAAAIEAVDPAEWPLAGHLAAVDAARIARGDTT